MPVVLRRRRERAREKRKSRRDNNVPVKFVIYGRRNLLALKHELNYFILVSQSLTMRACSVVVKPILCEKVFLARLQCSAKASQLASRVNNENVQHVVRVFATTTHSGIVHHAATHNVSQRGCFGKIDEAKRRAS